MTATVHAANQLADVLRLRRILADARTTVLRGEVDWLPVHLSRSLPRVQRARLLTNDIHTLCGTFRSATIYAAAYKFLACWSGDMLTPTVMAKAIAACIVETDERVASAVAERLTA